MFGYLSLLVQNGYFDEIQVNFLIVGHTHTTIDQYFSVITYKMRGKFIASPLALQHLFNSCQDPLINRQLTAFYDYRAWLTPVINKDLHHYGLPHVFVFKYSRSSRFLPVEPDHIPKDQAGVRQLSRLLSVEPLSFIGGTEAIHNVLEIPTTANAIAITSNQELLNKMISYRDILTPLNNIEARVSCETANRFELQADIGYLTTLTDEILEKTTNDENIDANNNNYNNNDDDDDDDSDDNTIVTTNKSSASKALKPKLTLDTSVSVKEVNSDQLNKFKTALTKHNKDETGYLLWLQYDKVSEEWHSTSPKLFDSFTDVRCFNKYFSFDSDLMQ